MASSSYDGGLEQRGVEHGAFQAKAESGHDA